MLLPSSKGWINKYFSLVEKGSIGINYSNPSTYSKHRHLHILSGKTGIIFGHVSRFLFYNIDDSKKWTDDEKLKLLLFETLLLVYIQKNGVQTNFKEKFVESIFTFYTQNKEKSNNFFFQFFTDDSQISKLETIFSKRIDVSKGILDNRWWFKSMSNVFVYLDVILYYQFVNENNNEVLNNYSNYTYNSLIAILLAAQSDGIIDEKENAMFQVFLSSANLTGELKEKSLNLLKTGASCSDFNYLVHEDKLFSRFLIDLALLTIFGNHESGIQTVETNFITNDLAHFLHLEDYDIEESMVMIEHFLLYSNLKNNILTNQNIYDKISKSLYNRWVKLILRNKDKLAVELTESKELVGLIKKSTTQDLTNEEKEKVRTQFLDLVKSIPALAIFMLPGGAILLPFILKLLPDLIPSAFRDNEIEK